MKNELQRAVEALGNMRLMLLSYDHGAGLKVDYLHECISVALNALRSLPPEGQNPDRLARMEEAGDAMYKSLGMNIDFIRMDWKEQAFRARDEWDRAKSTPNKEGE